MLNNGGTRHWISEMEVPYVVRGDQWVGYDDEQSLRLKVNIFFTGGSRSGGGGGSKVPPKMSKISVFVTDA